MMPQELPPIFLLCNLSLSAFCTEGLFAWLKTGCQQQPGKHISILMPKERRESRSPTHGAQASSQLVWCDQFRTHSLPRTDKLPGKCLVLTDKLRVAKFHLELGRRNGTWIKAGRSNGEGMLSREPTRPKTHILPFPCKIPSFHIDSITQPVAASPCLWLVVEL